MTPRLFFRPQAKTELFTALSGTVRHAVLRRFPYSVLFAYENDEVVILAIHHHRQAPTRWQSDPS